MSTDESRVPHGPDDDPRDYGRQLALDGLLESAFAAERSVARRRRFRIWTAAAALLAGIVVFFFVQQTPQATALARVERIQGTVHVLAAEPKTVASLGQELRSGQGLEVLGRAAVRIADGTLIELGPDTTVTELTDRGGVTVVVSRGTLAANVKRQPAGRPMVFRFPQGEATVLGTSLKLVVEPDEARGSTRLEVTEGKVRLSRRADGKSVEVVGGHFAMAAIGIELAAKPLSSTPAKAITYSKKVEDASIYGHATFENKNYGSRARLRISYGLPGGYTGLLKFPELIGSQPGQVPPGAVIRSASLRLKSLQRYESGSVTLRISRCLKPWNAGQGDGGPAMPGDVTWNSAQHGSLPWEKPGARGPSDRSPELRNSLGLVDSAGCATFDVTAAVQAWANGEANYGLILDALPYKVDEVASSNDPNPDHRPQLTITLKE